MQTDLVAGTVVGDDFVVERELSHGGMGAIYVCLQRSTGKRRALKVMLPELVSHAGFRERFELEARVGSRIDSDHVVEVVGAGVTPFPWMAMELLDGEDLFAHVQKTGPLTFEMTSTVLEQACHGLGAAHAAGIVHRDLKPDNVFLARSRQVGAPFMVKILDFGISKITDEASTRARANTGFMGTRPWMAPEQTTVGATIGPQADVWALGLIAFFLLTGKYYWRAMYDANSNDVMLMMEVCATGVLDPPSVRAHDLGFVGALPAGFDAWFARCVTRDVHARFPDARQAFAGFQAMVRPGALPLSGLNATMPMDADVATILGSASATEVVPQATAVMTPQLATTNAPQHTAIPELPKPKPKPEPQGPDVRTIGMMVGGMVAVIGFGFVIGRARNAPQAPKAEPAPIVAEPTPAPTTPTPTAATVAKAAELPTEVEISEAEKVVWKVPVGTSPTLGPDDARVTIITFGDYQCPYCKKVELVRARLRAAYGGKLRFVWKDLPLAFHGRAKPCANAAREVRSQKGTEAFWAFHDALFESAPLLEDPDLEAAAKKVPGVDPARVLAAATSDKFGTQIKTDVDLAGTLDTNGTPTIFLNGRKVSGAQDYEKFKAIVDEELPKAEAMINADTPATKVYDRIIASGKTI